MAGDRNVEFVLRARDEATAELKKLRAALSGVVDTQEDVADRLASTNPQFAELNSVSGKLRNTLSSLGDTLGDVGKALRKQGALDKVTASLREQEAVVRSLAQEQADAAAKSQKAGAAYAEQARKVDELENSLTALTARQKQLSATFEFVKEYQRLETALEGYIARQGQARTVVAQLEAEVVRLTAAQRANAAEQARISAAQAQGRTATSAIEDALALVAAYRKQREEVEKTNARFDEQNKKLDEARAKASVKQGADGAAATQTKAVERLEQATGRLAAKQREQNVALEIARRNLDTAGVSAADLDATETALKDALARNNALLAQQKSRLADLAKEGGAVEKNIGSAQRQIAGLNKELTAEGRGTGLEQKIAATSAEIDKLGDRARKAGVNTADLLTPLDQLEKEARTTADAIERLPVSLEFAGKALVELKNEAGASAQALKQADAALERSQGGYAKTAARVDELQKELAPLEQGLTEAGVATDRLADEQGRLQGELAQTAAETKKVTAAEKAMVAEKVRADRVQQNGIELKRTALSLTQRLRGQILSLAAAYGGLYSVVSQVTQAFRAGSQARGIEVGLGAINNNELAATGEELEYIRGLADAVGQEYLALAKSYTQFRASVADKLPLEQQRFLFESIAKAATVMNLSTEDAEGTFRAIAQTFSKGKVTAEELRQQLGDRLPGAVRLLATGLGVTEGELNKLLETGQLTADQLLFLAKQANTEFGSGLAKALQSPLAQFNRLKNTVQELREEFFREAEAAGLGQVLKDLADTLRGPEVANAVRSLAQAFVDILKLLPFLAKNLDAIGILIVTFLGGHAIVALTRLAGKFGEAKKAATSFFSTVDVEGKKSLTGMQRLAGAVGLILTAYSSLKVLIETNTPFRQFVVKSIAYLDLLQGGFRERFANAFAWLDNILDKAGVHIFTAFSVGFTQAKGVALTVFKFLDEMFVEWVRKAARVAEHLGFDTLADSARKNFGQYNEEIQKAIDANISEIARLEGARDKDLKNLDEYLKKQYALNKEYGDPSRERALKVLGEVGRENRVGSRSAFNFAADPNITPNLPPAKDGAGEDGAGEDRDKAIKEAADFYADVFKRVSAVNDQIATDNADTLEERLDLIRREYADLMADLEKMATMGGTAAEKAANAAMAADFRKIVDARVKQLTEAETKSFAAQDIQRAEGGFQRERDKLSANIDEINAGVEAGAASTAGGERRIRELADSALPDLRFELDEVIAAQAKYNQLAGLSTDEIAAGEARLRQLQAQKAGLTELGAGLLSNKEKREAFFGAVSSSFSAFSDGIYNAVTGVGDLGDAFDGAGKALAQFAADFLRRIADMILQQALFNALAGSAFGKFVGIQAPATPVQHSGGMAGTSNRTRAVSPAWFMNAQRFHSGGLPGLKANEVPAILERGEEVLSKSNPRNIMNGGGTPATASPQRAQDIKIVNAIDSGSVVAAGLDTPDGTKAIINFFRANKSTLKTVLN